MLLSLLFVVPPATMSTTPSDLLVEARRLLDSCPVDCKPFGADVWLVRKRLASKEELLSMAVQVEQGDEACLCGRSGPAVIAVEREAMLLTEAVLLFHLGGDPAAAELNLDRLRTVYRKTPANLSVAELLIRAIAMMKGPEASIAEMVGLGEAARIHLLTSATLSRSLKLETKGPMLREALTAWEGFAGEEKAPLARTLLEGLEAAHLKGEADKLAASHPELASRLDRLRHMPKGMPPAPPRAVLVALETLARRPNNPGEILQPLLDAPNESQPVLFEAFGRFVHAKHLPSVVSLLAQLTPTQRLPLLIGLIKSQTRESVMILYEDFLQTHSWPK